ncbi:ATP-dependent RNA helicase DDX24-like [Pollicipes pollicipes]|uniref:ATP-dependent RNA helicase DDX24-like n=1 Tax=Pollicipes pollicipes TaxID=41117 RepID=UPI001884D1B2|nr:ATP-dependent RNA helicase DDX24-like [Pollicipes pollicipes]
MWKPSKPVSLADFMAGADNFGGVTLFEELPGTTAISKSLKTNKQCKKAVKPSAKKTLKSKKRVRDAVAEEDDGQEETSLPAPPRKKRKRRVARSAPSGPTSTAVEADPAAVIAASDTDVSNWEVLHVPPVLLAGLADLGYEQPTEIQRLCLPAAIRGRMDLVGAAETGSGKTLAFALPLLHGVLMERRRMADAADSGADDDAGDDGSDDGSLKTSGPIGPKALVLAPTRELAIQVKNHMVAVAKYTGIKVVTVVGGMSEQKQQRLLSRRPEVVVATPGRLWEFVEAGDPYLSTLSRLRFLVVDETDRMLEKGHFQQLHLLLERINADKDLAEKRQNFVFSATLTLGEEATWRDLRQLQKLSPEQKLKHVTSMVGIRPNNRKVVDITHALGTAASLTEMAVSCSIPEKDELLYYFALQHPGRTLVFCNSIDCVTRLGRLFTLLDMAPLVLHANMQQRQRLKNLQRFQARPAALLVATDVAARGLDVPGVQHVIHYQVPRTTDAYVHRSGRTARARAEGLSVVLVEPAEMAAYRRLLRQLHRVLLAV